MITRHSGRPCCRTAAAATPSSSPSFPDTPQPLAQPDCLLHSPLPLAAHPRCLLCSSLPPAQPCSTCCCHCYNSDGKKSRLTCPRNRGQLRAASPVDAGQGRWGGGGCGGCCCAWCRLLLCGDRWAAVWAPRQHPARPAAGQQRRLRSRRRAAAWGGAQYRWCCFSFSLLQGGHREEARGVGRGLHRPHATPCMLAAPSGSSLPLSAGRAMCNLHQAGTTTHKSAQ